MIDIYTCLHHACIQNDDDVCLQPGCMTLTVSVCSTLTFAVVSFSYTVKLSFVLDHAPSPFHFVTREITSEARTNFPLCGSVINKHTKQNK